MTVAASEGRRSGDYLPRAPSVDRGRDRGRALSPNGRSDYPPSRDRSPARGGAGSRYDDADRGRPRDGGPGEPRTKLYVGGITPRIEKRELEEVFERCGPLVSVEIKHGGFAFVEYEDARDAEDAVRKLRDYELNGSRLLIEFSRSSHGGGGGGCFLCGAPNHWARECPESRTRGMDVRSGLCFRCGQPGHLARHCSGGPSHHLPDNSYGGHGRGRSRSPYGRRRRTPSPYGGRGGYGGGHSGGYGNYNRRRSPMYNDYRGGPGYDDRRY